MAAYAVAWARRRAAGPASRAISHAISSFAVRARKTASRLPAASRPPSTERTSAADPSAATSSVQRRSSTVAAPSSAATLRTARKANDARRAAAAAPDQPPVSFEAALRLLLDKERYPRLHRLVWSAAADAGAGAGAGAMPDEHAEFLAGIDCILDGIQAQIDRAAKA